MDEEDPPPKYDSADVRAEGEEGGEAEKEEKGPRVATLQLVGGANSIVISAFS